MLQTDQEVVLAAVALGAEWPSAAACVGGAARRPGGVAGLERMDGGPGAHVDTTLIKGHDLLSFGASIDA